MRRGWALAPPAETSRRCHPFSQGNTGGASAPTPPHPLLPPLLVSPRRMENRVGGRLIAPTHLKQQMAMEIEAKPAA